MYNILVNWEELLAYFSSCEPKLSLHARCKCRLIKEMLADRMNYLYFTFITPIVQEFEKINSLFQQTNGDHMKFTKNCYFIMRVYIEDFMTKISRVKA